MPAPGHGSRLTRLHGAPAQAGDLRLSHVLGGLSGALDLADGHVPGHAARAAYIGMRLAEVIGLTEADRACLLVTLLLKDLGAPATARGFVSLFGTDDADMRRALRGVDWGRPLEAARFTAGHVGTMGWPARKWRQVTALKNGVPALRETMRVRADLAAELTRDLKLSGD